MTKQEYQNYVSRVENFFQRNSLNNLTSTSASPYFTWSACPVCGNRDGHNAEDANGFSTTEDIMEFEDVCQNCLYFASYGQLDDMTMMDLED